MENLQNIDSCQEERRVRRHHMSRKKRDIIFIICLLGYPVLQFVVCWTFVNINSIIMAFQYQYPDGTYQWTLQNFKDIFYGLTKGINTTGFSWMNNEWSVLFNSFGYCLITIFISLPLSLLFSYFLHKKMPAANVFRAIFFLPNIIPIVALTFSFAISFDSTMGYLYGFMRWLGFSDSFFSTYPTNQLLIYIYCIWAGLGYNIVLMSGAIGRIPKELFESAELDHAGYFKEFVHIVIPCIWPTIITLVILGMTNVLTLYLHPLLLTNGSNHTQTIALNVFGAAQSGSLIQTSKASAYGLFFSLVWAPIILLVRHFLSKKFKGVGY